MHAAKKQKINWKELIISIAFSLAVGALAALLTKDSYVIYETLAKPALAPPGWLFGVVWSILYVLMGISAYLVYSAPSGNRGTALKIYLAQLAVNFFWPIIFFNLQMYLLSFLWLVLLLILIVAMILAFGKISRAAANLQLPYFLWVLFAGYLNLSIYLLNR